ncbi:MAG TPA: hypothetical protein VIK39_09790 [Candidatus Angelobacter sp.]
MMLRFLSILLLCGSLASQGGFPHPMGPPNVKAEYLGKAHVSPQERRAILSLVFAGNAPSTCVSSERTLAQEIDSIRIARASLAPGERDLLVQASDNCNCGGTGNCAFWILRERPGGFDTLLAADMVQTFSVEPSSSNGYKNVMTSAHGSASYSDLALYQFDGKRYRKTHCAGEEYTQREDGSFSDKPTITPTECGAE